MKFKLAKYDINGKFYGFEDFGKQMFLCDIPDDSLSQLITIGTTMSHKCTIDLTRLLRNVNSQNANMFYELFLIDYNKNMIEVPIKITDYSDDVMGWDNT
jgi:hypothetical protein